MKRLLLAGTSALALLAGAAGATTFTFTGAVQSFTIPTGPTTSPLPALRAAPANSTLSRGSPAAMAPSAAAMRFSPPAQ